MLKMITPTYISHFLKSPPYEDSFLVLAWAGLSEGCHPLTTCIPLCLGMQELHELAKGRHAFQTYSMVIKHSKLQCRSAP